jgi:hypothetical protein
MPYHTDNKMTTPKPKANNAKPKANGLTEKQKKNLPANLQKAILAKQKKNKK